MEAAIANSGIEGEDMANRAYPIFRAWTEPNRHGHGFIAFWASPGLDPEMLRGLDRRPLIFSDRDAGELAAWRRMAEVLNRPRIKANQQQGKAERYKRLTGPEFAAELREAGITPTFLSYLYGTSQHRVLKWLDGAEDIPHPVRVLISLFQDSERNIDIAEDVTDRVTETRKPRRDD